MAKRKTTGRKSKSKSRSPGRLATLLEGLRERLSADRTRTAIRAAGWLLGIGGLAAAWALGVPALQQAVGAEAASAMAREPVRVMFLDAPAWVRNDRELMTMLTRTVLAEMDLDPLSGRDLAAAREQLLRTGCFESVEQVRQRRTDLIEVACIFLTPYAVVAHHDRQWMIDASGRRLPVGYRPPDGSAAEPGAPPPPHFITISGLHFDQPLRAGELWTGADLTAALRLLRLIDARPWRGQVQRVDLEGYMLGEPIVITTDSGTRIIWGSAPNEERNLEIDADEKLKRLDFWYAERGRIDGHHQGELDLTDPLGVFAR